MQGINVIGHVSSPSGLGVSARHFIRAITERGVPVAVLDVDYGLSRSAISLPSSVQVVSQAGELPHRVNLVLIAIHLLPKLLLRLHPSLLESRFFNAGIVFWELPKVPRVWIRALRLFDALVACSPFIRQTLETQLPEVPTVWAEHPLYLPAPIRWRREELGFDSSTFVFGASFDLGGDISRKNPAAVVRAFLSAFSRDDRVGLVLKGNGTLENISHPAVSEIRAAISSDRRIRFISETMPYERVIGLYASCDAFVSLHRAEGLGLGPMEAMAMGIPTVATGYSGNMNYMTESNSWPVRYRLVPTSQCSWQYTRAYCGDGAWWAQPDESHAASILRSIAFDDTTRIEIAAKGQMDVAARQCVARKAEFLGEIHRLAELGEVERIERGARRVSLLLNDLFHPVHIRMFARRFVR